MGESVVLSVADRVQVIAMNRRTSEMPARATS